MYSFYSSLTSRIRRKDDRRRSVQCESEAVSTDSGGGRVADMNSPDHRQTSEDDDGSPQPPDRQPVERPHPLKRGTSMDEALDGGDSDSTIPGVFNSCASEERRRSSSADSEVADNWDFQWRNVIFDPDGQAYYYWLAVSAMAAMYNCGILILRLAFSELRDADPYQTLFSFLDYLSDVIYLIDIGVHLRTGYLEEGIMVLDPEKLKQNYKQKRDFKLAVLSLVPLGSVVIALSRIGSLLGITVIDRYQVHSPITRIHRLLKYHIVPKFFEITDSQTSNPNVVRAFKLSLYLWIVIHWIGCFYYMVSEYEGFGSNEWVYPSSLDSQRLLRKYTLCIYWSMMTLTTIGERPPPETDIEYIFTGLTFLIGVFVFAAVVGNVGDVISNMNAARQDYIARMDQIKFYMNHRKVPTFLQNRVKRWADYSWTRTQAIDEASLLEMLPERIRTEIAIHTNLDTLKKVQIFEECEEGLLQELVLKLRPQIFSPRDYICRKGEIGREMYIINHGKVEILVHNPTTGGKMVVATLMSGNYFGEISLLKLDAGQNRRTADVRSVGYSELLCLSRKDLITALVEYPDAKIILEKKARERMQMNKQVRRSSGPDVLSEEETAQPSRPNPSHDQPISKKSKLADVIRSNMFQTLLSKRGKEMMELKDLINELKSFDSQATKLRIQQLSDKCEGLMRQLRTRDTELREAIQRIAELEQVILGPAKRKWIAFERNGFKALETRVERVSVEETDDDPGTNIDRPFSDLDYPVPGRNGNGIHVINTAGTNGNSHPANEQTLHSDYSGSALRPANGQNNSLVSKCLTGNTERIIPKINYMPAQEPPTRDITNSDNCSENGEDIDIDTALLAVMTLGENQPLSDVSNSNSGSSVSSDVDSDYSMDL